MMGKWMFCVMIAVVVGLSVPCNAPEQTILPTVLFIGNQPTEDLLDLRQIDSVSAGNMADVLAQREYQCVIFRLDSGESPEFLLESYRMAATLMIRTQPQAEIILQGIPGENVLNEGIRQLAVQFRIHYTQPSDFCIYDH